MGRTRAATPAGRKRSSQAKPAAKPARSAAKTTTKPKSARSAKTTAKPKRAAAKRPAGGAAKRVRDPKRAKRATPSPSPRPKLLASLRPGRRRKRKAPARRVSWRYRLGLVAIVVVAAGAGYLFWLRDSSLVAIDNVDVVGVTSGDREQIVAELTRAGESMTTLHVDRERIESAAAAFPTVDSVSLDPNFPHGLRIEVDERPPALLVSSGEQQVAVAADGTLLNGVEVPEDEPLPVVEVDEIPPEGSLGGEPLEQALVAGATPEPLRPMVERVDHDEEIGVLVELRGGVPVRFGSGSRAAEKWAAAAAVLADPKLDAVTYVDVRVPERPAAGGAAIAGVSTDPPA
jgi:cell division septal protein FtsQ